MATLYGGNSNNTLNGTTGNDSIYAGGGQDIAFGGAGNDFLDGGTGHDVQYGGAGDDTLIGGTGYDRMFGEDGNDLLIGDDLDFDDLFGGAGNDTIFAGNSNDDWAFGETGDDVIYMDGGFDLAFGGTGADTLYGGGGSDTLKGDLGDDLLLGEADNDWLNGGEGQDTLSGGTGVDTLYGGGGNDQLAGGDGNDAIWGDSHEFSTGWYAARGDANTTLDVTNNADFAVELYWIDGYGTPVYYATLDAGDSVSLSTGADHHWFLTDAATEARLALFSAGEGASFTFTGDFNDTIDGGAGDDTIHAEYGDDSVVGGLGNDLIHGDAGNDTLEGGAGSDTLLGGVGDDRIEVRGADSTGGDPGIDSIDGGDGSDRLALSDGGGVSLSFSADGTGSYAFQSGGSGAFSGIEGIEGTALGDTINAAATGAGVAIDSGAGNDLIFGGAGADTLLFGAGDDAVFGGAGDDFIDDAVNVQLGGANQVYAGDGQDTVYTGSGNDILLGGAGDDLLVAEDGNDMLSGGTGADTLYGGAGQDLFHLTLAGGDDRIGDFDLTPVAGRATDQLDVSDLRGLDGQPIRWRDVTVTDDGAGNARLVFPEGESLVLEGIAPEQVDSKQEMAAIGIPCFVEGTRLLTTEAPVAVEGLHPGHRLIVAEGPPQPVLWTGQRRLGPARLQARPDARPFAHSAPCQPRLCLSGQHALVVEAADGQGPPRLARIAHLAAAGVAGVRPCSGRRQVVYWHVLLPRHALVQAEGRWAETLYPGPVALAALGRGARVRLFAQRPELAAVLAGQAEVAQAYGPRALPLLSRREVLAGGAGWRIRAAGGFGAAPQPGAEIAPASPGAG